jgi:hypothetical protein
MIDRKKRLRFIQFFLLGFGVLIIYATYYNKDPKITTEIISQSNKEKIKKQNEGKVSNKKDTFFNVEYTGLDLNGNRYNLQSEEAYFDELKGEITHMNVVQAIFYFKDDTVLYVWADKGIYNNKTLDMKFENNVKANYLESKLFAEKADYSNTDSYLSIYDNVRINNKRGNLIADKLLFDITKQKLDISSFNDGRINANVNLNEKRF